MTEAEVLRTHVDLFNGALKSRDWDELAATYSDRYEIPVLIRFAFHRKLFAKKGGSGWNL